MMFRIVIEAAEEDLTHACRLSFYRLVTYTGLATNIHGGSIYERLIS